MSMEALIVELEEAIDVVRSFRDVLDLLSRVQSDGAADIEALSFAFRAYLGFCHQKDHPSEFAFSHDVEPATVVRWRNAFEHATKTVLKARLGDLLWTVKSQPRPDIAARAAIDAYLQMAQTWEGIEAMHCTARAADLARALSDKERILQAHALAEAMFVATIEDTSSPGVSLGYLNILAFAPAHVRHTALQPLIDRAKAALNANPHLCDSIIEAEEHLASGDDTKLRSLQVERARLWEHHASIQAEAFRGYFFLHRAAEAAANLPEERERLLRKIRDTDISTLGLQEHRVEISIDLWTVLEARRRLLDSENAMDALDRVLEYGPPSGSAHKNEETAKEVVESSILAAIATQISIDPHTRQARPINSEDQKRDKELGEIETRHLTIELDLVLGPVLMYLPVRHPVGAAELVAWLDSDGIGAAIATVVANALIDWWTGGDNLGIAMRLVNAIEALARHRLEQVEGTVLDMATASQRGGYRPIGDVLSDLNACIDESWCRFLRCVLISEHGLNLRNRLCHGIVHGISNMGVAALVIAALYLARTRPSPKPIRPS